MKWGSAVVDNTKFKTVKISTDDIPSKENIEITINKLNHFSKVLIEIYGDTYKDEAKAYRELASFIDVIYQRL